jgi:PAP2 superfamily
MLLGFAAVVVTAASKIAFIGWGIGWPEANFTGISGHAMFATAVYPPLLLCALTARQARTGRRWATAAGGLIALLVGMSRVEIGAHSISEVLAGWLVGGIAAIFPLAFSRWPREPISLVIPAAMTLWLLLTPGGVAALQTHSAVTRLALYVSGRDLPYTRDDMLRELRLRKGLVPTACPFANDWLCAPPPKT